MFLLKFNKSKISILISMHHIFTNDDIHYLFKKNRNAFEMQLLKIKSVGISLPILGPHPFNCPRHLFSHSNMQKIAGKAIKVSSIAIFF